MFRLHSGVLAGTLSGGSVVTAMGMGMNKSSFAAGGGEYVCWDQGGDGNGDGAFDVGLMGLEGADWGEAIHMHLS